jgi:hypothetical protein
MLTPINIAMIGGVILMLLLLVKVRKDRAAGGTPKAPKAPKATGGRFGRRKAAQAPPPAPSTPLLNVAAAETAATTLAPPAPVALAEPEPVWTMEDVVTEPGWPLPGDSELEWEQDAVVADQPTVADLPAVEAEAHTPVAQVASHAARVPVAEDPTATFDPAAGWAVETEPAATAAEPQWILEPVAAPAADEAVSWNAADEPDPDLGPEWGTPDPEAAPAWVADDAIAVAPQDEALAMWSSPESPDPSEDSFSTTLAQWSTMSPVDAPDSEPAPAPVVAPSPLAAWAALVPRGAATAAVAEVDDPSWGMGVVSGRFALGGHAAEAGQRTVGGVTFRTPVDEAPARWAVAPAPDAPGGTLVLRIEGRVNCRPEDVAVITEPGFAPSTEGFAVQLTAEGPGPFAASGTFEVTA